VANFVTPDIFIYTIIWT